MAASDTVRFCHSSSTPPFVSGSALTSFQPSPSKWSRMSVSALVVLVASIPYNPLRFGFRGSTLWSVKSPSFFSGFLGMLGAGGRFQHPANVVRTLYRLRIRVELRQFFRSKLFDQGKLLLFKHE